MISKKTMMQTYLTRPNFQMKVTVEIINIMMKKIRLQIVDNESDENKS